MNKDRPDKFSLHVPDETEPERSLPERLALEDTAGKTKAKRLPHGAYNPYENTAQRKARPKPRDLRKLSEWMRLKQKVQAQRDETSPDGKPSKSKSR
jgi:hypothetical protein